MNLSTRAMLIAQLTNMTNEINTATETAVTKITKGNVFLGLYLPPDLKDKVAAAARAEDRSMSKYAIRVFEKHFSKA